MACCALIETKVDQVAAIRARSESSDVASAKTVERPMSNLLRISLAAASLVLISGCVSTQFLAYEGRTDLVFEGTGGGRTVVNGIDFWEQGDPPRRYRLIGYIKDERCHGAIYQATMRGDVADKAKAAGGDAVMMLSSTSTITGYASTGSGSSTTTYNSRTSTTTGVGSAVTVPLGRSEGQFAVLKYIR